jgi:predicted nucleotidyltransferase
VALGAWHLDCFVTVSMQESASNTVALLPDTTQDTTGVPAAGSARQDATRSRVSEKSPDLVGVDDLAFARVLGDCCNAFDIAGIPYAIIGGIAATGLGRPRWTNDIDLLVKPEDADRALEALQARGFETEKTDTRWLYKAYKDHVLVDVLFKSTGDVYLDAEMIERSVEVEFLGHRVRFVPPEDLLIMKAVVHSEVGPHHWHDALGILTRGGLDWEYFERRARRAPRRVLALLIYAHSLDLSVPNRVIANLFRAVYES